MPFLHKIPAYQVGGHPNVMHYALWRYALDRLYKSRTAACGFMRLFGHCAKLQPFLRWSWFLSIEVPFNASWISYSTPGSVVFWMCTRGRPDFSGLKKHHSHFPYFHVCHAAVVPGVFSLPTVRLLHLRYAYITIVDWNTDFKFPVRFCTMHKTRMRLVRNLSIMTRSTVHKRMDIARVSLSQVRSGCAQARRVAVLSRVDGRHHRTRKLQLFAELRVRPSFFHFGTLLIVFRILVPVASVLVVSAIAGNSWLFPHALYVESSTVGGQPTDSSSKEGDIAKTL
jgi:hypothetical protein